MWSVNYSLKKKNEVSSSGTSSVRGQLCVPMNPPRNPDTEHFHHFPKTPFPFLGSTPGSQWSVFLFSVGGVTLSLFVTVDLSAFSANEILQCGLSHRASPAPRDGSDRICVVGSPLYPRAAGTPLYFCLYTFVHPHSGCFRCGAPVNEAVVSITGQVITWT